MVVAINQLNIIYKTVIHKNLVNSLTNEVGSQLPDLVISQHAEDASTIYPTSIADNESEYTLRLAYDEAALFDSYYCANRLNSYALFISSSNSGSDYIAEHYYSSSTDFHNTLTYQINDGVIPDVAIKRFE